MSFVDQIECHDFIFQDNLVIVVLIPVFFVVWVIVATVVIFFSVAGFFLSTLILLPLPFFDRYIFCESSHLCCGIARLSQPPRYFVLSAVSSFSMNTKLN